MRRSTRSASAQREIHTPTATPQPCATVSATVLQSTRFKRPEMAVQQLQPASAELPKESTKRSMGDEQLHPWDDLAAVCVLVKEIEPPPAVPKVKAVRKRDATVPDSSTEQPRKRQRDTNEPRQPDTPYTCFWRHERRLVVAKYPSMSGPDVSREVGQRWRALSDSQRKKWNDAATRDKERFVAEAAALASTQLVSYAAVDATAVPMRQSISAFQFFLSKHRATFALLTFTPREFLSEMRLLWDKMTDDDKQRWFNMELADKKRLENKWQAQSCIDPPVMARLADLKRAVRAMNDGPPLPLTAFEIFAMSQQLDSQSTATQPHAASVAAWAALPTSGKLPFIVLEQRDVERFVRDMEDLDGLNHDWCAPASVELPASEESEDARRQQRVTRHKAVSGLRKPLNAFNTMCAMRRAELMTTHQLTHNDCSALCGQLWSSMTHAERQRYYDVAAADKARYERELRGHKMR